MTKVPRPSSSPLAGSPRELTASDRAAIRKIALLLNLGPKSAAWLVEAGVTDLDKLRKLGPVVAYLKVLAIEPQASLNLLWALAGALEGCAWNALAAGTRASLLIELEARQEVIPYKPLPPPPPGTKVKKSTRKKAR